MITKAIVEERIDPFHYRVRMPIFDRVPDSPIHTRFEDLASATLCVPKGMNNSIQVGDIVFVGFEDNVASKPIILGHLYREAILKEHESSLNAFDVHIEGSATLPFETSIGNINFQTLYKYIQDIDELKNKVQELESKLNG